MSAQKIDIDRVARDAQRENKKPVSLANKDIFLEPANWNLIIEPLTPKQESAGGIIISQEAQSVEQVQCCCGLVLSCGPTSLTGQTVSGIRLCEVTNTINKPQQLIGKYVVYQKYTGQMIKLRRYQKSVLFLKADEILAVCSNPDELEFWL